MSMSEMTFVEAYSTLLTFPLRTRRTLVPYCGHSREQGRINHSVTTFRKYTQRVKIDSSIGATKKTVPGPIVLL